MRTKQFRVLLFITTCLGVVGSPASGYSLVKKESRASELSQDVLLKEISGGFSKIAAMATPAVVYIESFPKNDTPVITPTPGRRGPYENPFDYFNDEFFNRFFGLPPHRERPQSKEAVRGTGFIVSEDGYIVTNNHVVENTGKIHVTLHDGQKYTATVIGLDPKTDLAVIKIKAEKLPHLSFGNSDNLQVGDWAIAIGNPFGLQATVTVGVISAKGRNQLHIADFEDFIQTDAAINPGNSGGPLLNIDGQVIGVNTAIVSGSGGYIGIGFAIPSLMANRIIDQLIHEGQVTRGFLGVTLQPIDAELAACYKLNKIYGALITDVVKGSPADKAGLKQEDVIVAYNGKEVDSLSTFRNAISLMSPNSRVVLKIVREGKFLEVPVMIAQAPKEEGVSSLQRVGIRVQNLTAEHAKKLGISPETKGVIIVSVEPGSTAAASGIAPGQLILAVNRQRVSSVDELNAVLKDSGNDSILLMVSQGEVIRFVALKPEE
ncbi:serine protease HtrA [Chlamydia pecorum]|uniref:Periplasmic serine endoprotease DegP-like n=1 Tax=Chlamydia pecorum (strain ATCC VR-628 / DSM 29919 / E58) TaxID=331635 RepID=A0AA34RCA7_CHLPE|nr:DegQ family serine endoprotease [Chlamydia pecorum]AEB41090.1 serine proteinase, HtrA/DegQ/DegS family [Chlamydia pecorum E58]AGW40080.1 serine protease [Chlamydia pecorum P787]UFP06684.1 DegQ family serine endoprotease [Chlamydia pecorum]UJT76476.1 serine proteinase, HtrA/DegQ/DegS family [Chlamydia pecorum]